MADAKVFLNHLTQLNDNFYLNMENFDDNYINNFFLNDADQQNDIGYMRMKANITKNNSDLFEFSSKLDNELLKLSDSILSKKKTLENVQTINRDLKKKVSNNMSSIQTVKQSAKDKQLLYNLNNIVIFNYILGGIFGIYIISNL